MGCNLSILPTGNVNYIRFFLQTGNVYYIDKPRKGENPSGALKTYGSGKDF